MNRINALIVEDEKVSRIYLQDMLKSLCSHVNVVAHAEDLKEAAVIVKNMHVPLDVAFLDIKLPDGIIFEWLEGMEKIDFDIIFITAFNEYTNKAFDYASVGYVLKPIDPDQLIDAVKRIKPGSSNMIKERIRLSHDSVRNNNNSDVICIPSSDGFRLLNLNEIIRFEASDNYTYIYTTDETSKYTVSKSLKIFEEPSSLKNFFRIHKSHIVNLKYIEKYLKVDNEVEMKDGKKISVARRRQPEFLRYLNSLRFDK